VIYEQCVRSGAGDSIVIFSARTDSVAAESKQMQIVDGIFAYAQTSNVISMRAPDPSLKKKSRTERMSRLEREYRW
jgi:hypothetical protein